MSTRFSDLPDLPEGVEAEVPTVATNPDDGQLDNYKTPIMNRAETQENIDRLDAQDESLDLKIDTEISRLDTELAQEIQDRIDGDAALDLKIDNLETDLNTEISRVENESISRDDALGVRIDDVEEDLATETAARIAGDIALQDNITAEETARIAADMALGGRIDDVESDLSDETAARIAADEALGVRIDDVQVDLAQEVLDRMAGDDALQTEVDRVESESMARDGVLQDNIDQEATDRIQGDADTLQAANAYTDAATAPLVPEAPQDGQQYARQNATWQVVELPEGGIVVVGADEIANILALDPDQGEVLPGHLWICLDDGVLDDPSSPMDGAPIGIGDGLTYTLGGYWIVSYIGDIDLTGDWEITDGDFVTQQPFGYTSRDQLGNKRNVVTLDQDGDVSVGDWDGVTPTARVGLLVSDSDGVGGDAYIVHEINNPSAQYPIIHTGNFDQHDIENKTASEARDNALTGRIDTTDANLAQEIIDRTEGDDALHARVNLTDANLAQEVSDRIAGDDALGLRIDGVESDVEGVESDLADEIAARIAGDDALGLRIDGVESDLSDETAARIAGDTALGLRIDDVESDLADETAARIAADDALGLRIDTVESDLSDETAARIAGDDALGLRIDGVESDLAQEVADRIEGDQNLQDQIDEIDWRRYAMRDADLIAMREANDNQFAASGFVHFGKHDGAVGATTVNEGLTSNVTVNTWVNRLGLGRVGTSPNNAGTSKTDFAVSHVSGFTSNISRVNLDSVNTDSFIKFPDAPDGTVIYDSAGDARGTGQVNLDLLNEVDPKYGDVAANRNEAVARAFEGQCKNGDFRNGDEGWVDNDGIGDFTGGSLRFQATSSGATQNIYTDTDNVGDEYFPAGTTVVCEAKYTDSSSFVNLILRSSANAGEGWPQQQVFRSLNDAQDGTLRLEMTLNNPANNLRFIIETGTGGGDGAITISNVRVYDKNEEVVTERHDMFGGEFFLEQITEENPYFYDNGMIQSQSPEINGVETERSNRPDSYYAVFDGDDDSAGLGVDFWAASWQEKIAFLSDKSNNLYIIKDAFGVDILVQWRMRQRTVSGMGNGDWSYVNNYLRFASNAETMVRPQGFLDEYPEYDGVTADHSFFGRWNQQNTVNPDTQVGIYSGAKWTSTHPDNREKYAVLGLVYFHQWGVVPRINQGAYHPSFNPFGARNFVQGFVGWDLDWYQVQVRDQSDCFEVHTLGTAPSAYPTAFETSGSIGLPSGREDGKLYDGIYASGQGGVIDYRLSAWDMGSKEEAAKVFDRVLSGVYRGKQRIEEWRINYGVNPAISGTNIYLGFALGVEDPDVIGGFPAANSTIGKRCWIRITGLGDCTLTTGTNLNTWYDCEVYSHPTSWATARNPNTNTDRWIDSGNASTLTIDVAAGVYVDGVVSDEFLLGDVVGTIEGIVETPDLRNGWHGSWIGAPLGTSGTNNLSRKAEEDFDTRMHIWQGTAWTFYQRPISSSRNFITSIGIGEVGIKFYTTIAYQSFMDDNRIIFNSHAGIGDVWISKYSPTDQGCHFADSCMMKVLTDSTAGQVPRLARYNLTRHSLNPAAGGYRLTQDGSFGNTEHPPLNLNTPDGDGTGIKALWYQVSNAQQLQLNFAYNQLQHVGSYADIGVININDGNVSQDGVAGNIYRVQHTGNNSLNHKLIYCMNAFQASWNDGGWVEMPEGDFTYATAPSGTRFARKFGEFRDYWGDDNRIRVNDNRIMFNNLFGELMQSGTTGLTLPYGFTKNHARAGDQRLGVDL